MFNLENLKNFIGIVLGIIGFDYCSICGSKLKIVGYHGYYGDPVYHCPRESEHGTNKPGGNIVYV